MISFVCGIKNKSNKLTYKTERLTDTENKHDYQRGKSGKRDKLGVWGLWIHSSCSVPQSCPSLSGPMGCSTPGFPVLHHLPELAQTHVH